MSVCASRQCSQSSSNDCNRMFDGAIPLFFSYNCVSAKTLQKAEEFVRTPTHVCSLSGPSMSLTITVFCWKRKAFGREQSCKCRLPGPLTPAKRAREAQLGGASQAGSSLASPAQRLKTEPTSGASTATATGAAAAAGSMPGDDLPPVIAPPGRSASHTQAAALQGYGRTQDTV